MLAFAMTHLFFAHFTGVPHHPEDVSTVIKLWPLFLAMIEVAAFVFRMRLKQAWRWLAGHVVWFTPATRTKSQWCAELERNQSARPVGLYCQFGWHAILVRFA
jgi:hypothetical protein